MRHELITLAFNLQETKRLLRILEEANKFRTSDIVGNIAKTLQAQIAEREAVPVAPWRKVVGKAKGNSLRNYYEELECGHRYRLRTSKNWMEDHAGKRRCLDCLKAQS